MNTKLDAARELKKFARQFKAVLELGDDIESLGSIDRAIKETDGLLQASRGELGKVQEQVKQAAVARDAAFAEAKTCKAQCDQALNKAKDDGAAIIASAKAETSRQIAERAAKLKAVQADIDKAMSDLAGINDQCQQAQLQLENTKKQLRNLHSGIGTLA